jgi:hypothetical protein
MSSIVVTIFELGATPAPLNVGSEVTHNGGACLGNTKILF